MGEKRARWGEENAQKREKKTQREDHGRKVRRVKKKKTSQETQILEIRRRTSEGKKDKRW